MKNKKNYIIIALIILIVITISVDFYFIFYKKTGNKANESVFINYSCIKDKDIETIQNGVYVGGVLQDNVTVFLYHINGDILIAYDKENNIYISNKNEKLTFENNIYFNQQKKEYKDLNYYYETDEDNMIINLPYHEEVKVDNLNEYLDNLKNDDYTCNEDNL